MGWDVACGRVTSTLTEEFLREEYVRKGQGTLSIGCEIGTTGTSRDAYLAKYRELVEAILDSPALAGFCYTQLTDTAQETNGLLTADRVPKLDPAAVRAITAGSRSR